MEKSCWILAVQGQAVLCVRLCDRITEEGCCRQEIKVVEGKCCKGPPWDAAMAYMLGIDADWTCLGLESSIKKKKKKSHNAELYNAWLLCLRPWIAVQDSLRHLHFMQFVGRDKHLKNVFTVSSIVCRCCLEARLETWKKGMGLNVFLFLKFRHVDSVLFPAKAPFVLRVYKAKENLSTRF